MSERAVTLEHVLADRAGAVPDLERINAPGLKQAARVWCGKEAAKLGKAECVRALTAALRDGRRAADVVRSLPANQREILAVCKRYGGAVSGAVLLAEAEARGLVKKIQDREAFYTWRRDDPVEELSAKLVLVRRHNDHYSGYYDSSYRRAYPDVALAPAVREVVEPAGPLAWQPTAPPAVPATTSGRPAAAVTLDLWAVGQALAQAGAWKTNRGGALPRSLLARLAKLFPETDPDPLRPPDRAGLYYELLRGLGAVQAEEDYGTIDLAALARHLRKSGPAQAWGWARAWLHMRLWQDGIGAVPERDSDYNPVRIDPGSLRTARELLAWALSRVAHGPGDWLDLETFLTDLWAAVGEDTISFYWGGYSWDPKFPLARNKEQIPAGRDRSLAFWLDYAGTWAANAVMGTLGHLGLVERGQAGRRGGGQPCFRLTALGRAVFGAPELAAAEPAYDARFLTVQPNHEVVAYLDAADPRAVGPLAQVARRTSAGDGPVQTFALTRDSVYQALEAGLALDGIRRFFADHSRSGLPANVDRSLAEWGGRREALVLRTDVTLGLFAPGSDPPFAGKGRPVGDRAVLLPQARDRRVRDVVVRDHHAFWHPAWRVGEDGGVALADGADAVARARLAQLADRDGDAWTITAASVGRARARGIGADQVLDWLTGHAAEPVPPLVETAIRNRYRPAPAFLGDLLVLRVPEPQAQALRASERFGPLLLEHIPPDWFIVRPERRAEAERLLAELGFALGSSYAISAPRRRGRREARE